MPDRIGDPKTSGAALALPFFSPESGTPADEVSSALQRASRPGRRPVVPNRRRRDVQLETMYSEIDVTGRNHRPEPAAGAQLRERAMGARPEHARRRSRRQPRSAWSSCVAPGGRSAAASTSRRSRRARSAMSFFRNWETALAQDRDDGCDRHRRRSSRTASAADSRSRSRATSASRATMRDSASRRSRKGIIPGIGMWRVARYAGLGRAKRLALTADVVDARTALDWGLVDCGRAGRRLRDADRRDDRARAGRWRRRRRGSRRS